MKTNASKKRRSAVPVRLEARQIVGIGIDIEEIRRFRGNGAAEQRMLRKVFTDTELAYCFSKKNAAQHLAARFAAKEAFYKALGGNLPHDFGFHDIEVLREQSGAPRIAVHGSVVGNISCMVSMSHGKEVATAIVLAMRAS